jgi:hypothetical protein
MFLWFVQFARIAIMNAEALRRFIEKRPFEPFEVQLSSGQVYRVGHPEAVMLLKNTLVIGDRETDAVVWCSLIHITAVRRQQETLTA